jgi:hypothetical protein
LLLPAPTALEACSGLDLRALQKLLSRARTEPLAATSLEEWLCTAFGVKGRAIAPVTLQADGVEPGTAAWMRADPVHLLLQREQMILQGGLRLEMEEAQALCASLNAHFAQDGLHFIAPHPQRWYVRVDTLPEMRALPLAQVAGRNILKLLPQGADALRWHQLGNEIQMLFYEHAVNQAREARGEVPVNSVWFWGGGRRGAALALPFSKVWSDSELTAAFAEAAGIPHATLSLQAAQCVAGEGDVLVVWEGLRDALRAGDLHAWRVSLQELEQRYIGPWLDALRNGRIARLVLHVPDDTVAQSFVLKRGDAWKFWRPGKPLARYTA